MDIPSGAELVPFRQGDAGAAAGHVRAAFRLRGRGSRGMSQIARAMLDFRNRMSKTDTDYSADQPSTKQVWIADDRPVIL
jgi:hypothetical protein